MQTPHRMFLPTHELKLRWFCCKATVLTTTSVCHTVTEFSLLGVIRNQVSR